MRKISSERVIWTSFLVDITDIGLNTIVALVSGSTVVLATALRSLADLMTTSFLLAGLHFSHRRANREHQFGFGRELYFWAFLSSLAMLTVTGGLAFYYGWQHYLHPEPVTNLPLALTILAIGMVTNLYALSLDIRRLRQSDFAQSLWHGFFRSNLVEIKIALVLDFMGIATALLGIITLSFYELIGDARLDGLGAILIASTVVLLAGYLILEIKDLLVGRSALPEVEADIKQATRRIKGVRAILDLRTMYIGSESLLVNMEVAMEPKLTTNSLEQLMDKIKTNVKQDVPAVKHIQVELETSL